MKSGEFVGIDPVKLRLARTADAAGSMPEDSRSSGVLISMNGPSCPRIGVVIPCYLVAPHLERVLTDIPRMVDEVIVVDDCCPESSGRIAERFRSTDARISVIFHKENLGVGGAVISGYRTALDRGCDVIVKLDGDGQMDPTDIPALVRPLVDGSADYAKGNRFRDFSALTGMPAVRLFGNSALSFLVKAASGYWNIMDPTNGFTAIHRRALTKLDLDRISRGFFFESDMLINLNPVAAVVRDVPMQARYGEERSSLKIGRVLLDFPFKLLRGLARRILLKYFIYDFNMASVYIALGVPLFIFGVLFGGIHWLDSLITGMPRSAGTIMLAALPIILSFQMLLQAIQIDIDRTPKRG